MWRVVDSRVVVAAPVDGCYPGGRWWGLESARSRLRRWPATPELLPLLGRTCVLPHRIQRPVIAMSMLCAFGRIDQRRLGTEGRV